MRTLLTFLALVFLLGASCRSNKEAVCPPVIIPTDCDAFRQQLMAIDEQYVFDSLIINGGDSSYILDSLGVRGMPLKTKDFDFAYGINSSAGCPYFVQFAPKSHKYSVSVNPMILTFMEFYTLIEGPDCTLYVSIVKTLCNSISINSRCYGPNLFLSNYLLRNPYYRVFYSQDKIRLVNKPGSIFSIFTFKKKP